MRRGSGGVRARRGLPRAAALQQREGLVDERRPWTVIADRVVRLVQSEQRVHNLEVARPAARSSTSCWPHASIACSCWSATWHSQARRPSSAIFASIVEEVGVGHRAAVLERGFAVRPEPGRHGRQPRSRTRAPRAVAGLLGMIGQPGERTRHDRAGREPVQHLPVQGAESAGRDARTAPPGG